MTADSDDEDAAVIGSPVRQNSAKRNNNSNPDNDLMFQTEIDVSGPTKYDNDVTPRKKSVKTLVSDYRSKIVTDPVFKPLI